VQKEGSEVVACCSNAEVLVSHRWTARANRLCSSLHIGECYQVMFPTGIAPAGFIMALPNEGPVAVGSCR
jgi:hypothetical protein